MAGRVHAGSRVRILVTNDDGVYSPGIHELARAASRFGDVRIVAPDVEQSSMAQAITASRPLHHRRAHVGHHLPAFRVDGTPSDCVALGTHVWGKVDLVFSGINLGLNVGNSMWHSGTLAAAKQAALLGVRGIAFSAPAAVDAEPDYEAILPWLDRVIEQLLDDDDPLVNVNFPEDPQGICWTRQSVRHYEGRVIPGRDPMGREHYWFVSVPIEAAEPGTDRHAIEHGYVSLTPLRLDLTDHRALGRRESEEAAEPSVALR